MRPSERLSPSLAESPRFKLPGTRRDFLGIAAIWSSVTACVAAAIGAFRLPMPSVFPESNPKVRVGPPESYPVGSATHLRELGLWIFRDEQGIYALSAICPHLGCVVARQSDGGFRCPCHGSTFSREGDVLGGPAPRGLSWLAVSTASNGQLEVDKLRTVTAGTRFRA